MVLGAGYLPAGVSYAMVPKSPVLDLEALMIASITEVVVVLPLVPVTATSCKRVAGMIVKIGGGNSESFASFANSNGGNAGRNHASEGFIAHHRDCAALNGVSNEGLAVFFRSAQREENCAGLYFARITNDLADFRSARQRRDRFDAVKYFR